MIRIYCHHQNHTEGKTLCPDGQELEDDCHFRLSKCPWKERKPFCSNCPIHCYNAEHREKFVRSCVFRGQECFLFIPSWQFATFAVRCMRNEKCRRGERHERKRNRKTIPVSFLKVGLYVAIFDYWLYFAWARYGSSFCLSFLRFLFIF